MFIYIYIYIYRYIHIYMVTWSHAVTRTQEWFRMSHVAHNLHDCNMFRFAVCCSVLQ